MIFDAIDYLLGYLKLIIYKLVYLNRMTFDFRGKFSSLAYVRITGRGRIKAGQNITVRSGTWIRINDGVLRIGRNVGLNNNCCVNCMDCIEIGDNVIMGQGVKIYDHDHDYKTGEVIRNNGYTTQKITIGNNVWIGSDCIILKGTSIGDNCVIGAASVVKGDIPKGSIFYNKRITSLRSIEG